MEKFDVLCVLLVFALPKCYCEDEFKEFSYDNLLLPPFKSSKDHLNVQFNLKIEDEAKYKVDGDFKVELTVTALDSNLMSIDKIDPNPVPLTAEHLGYYGEFNLTVSKRVDGVAGDLNATIECTSTPCNDKNITVYKETNKIRVELIDVSVDYDDQATITVTLTKDVTTAKPLDVMVILTGDNGEKQEEVVTLDGPGDKISPGKAVFTNLPLDNYRLNFACSEKSCIAVKPWLILPPPPLGKIEAQPGLNDQLKEMTEKYEKLKDDHDKIVALQEQLANYDTQQKEMKSNEKLHVQQLTTRLADYETIMISLGGMVCSAENGVFNFSQGSCMCDDQPCPQGVSSSAEPTSPTSPPEPTTVLPCTCPENKICNEPNVCVCDKKNGFIDSPSSSDACVQITCGKDLHIMHGKVSYMYDSSSQVAPYPYGTVATYSCNPGFKLDGDQTTTCNGINVTGTFEGSAPTCKPIVCDKLHAITNGKISYSGECKEANCSFETVATHSCDEGYVLNGEKNRTCVNTDSFNGTAPTCKSIVCKELNILNGDISYDPDHQTAPYKYKTVATHSCHEGYVLEGNVNRTCVDMNTFDGTAPTCSLPQVSGSTNNYYTMEIGVAVLVVVLIVGLVGYVLYHYRAQVKQWACAKKAAVGNLPRSIPGRLRRGGRYSKLPRTMQEALHQD